MENKKYCMTLKEAIEKYEPEGMTDKKLRRLVRQDIVGSQKRKGLIYVSGHEIRRHLDATSLEQEAKTKGFSVKDKDYVKVIKDVEAVRGQRLKNEKVITQVINKEKENFYQAFNAIFSGLPDMPRRLLLNNQQKETWNEWISEVCENIEREAKKIDNLQEWAKILDAATPTREEVKL